jgi:hypothetical protein
LYEVDNLSIRVPNSTRIRAISPMSNKNSEELVIAVKKLSLKSPSV